MSPMTSLWYLYCEYWIDFADFSGVCIGNFEQVNAGWVSSSFRELRTFEKNIAMAFPVTSQTVTVISFFFLTIALH